MKSLLRILIVFILFFNSLPAQQESQLDDPFQGNYNLGSSSEIVLFWHYDKSSDSTVNHKIFDYYGNTGNFILDSSSEGSYTGNLGTGFENGFADFHFESVTGDFDGDGLDNLIAAWETTNNSINIIIPEINKSTLSWNNEKLFTLTNILNSNPYNHNSMRFRIIKGYFDGDPYPEIALAYWNQDGNIEIKIYDIDSINLMPVEKASIADEYLDPSLLNSGLYDIAAGDFDGDLRDEIVLAGYIDSGTWHIFTKVYDYVENNGNFSLIARVKNDNFYTQNDFFDSDYRVNNIAVAAGDFLNNTIDQFVVDFVLYKNDSETYNKLLPASVELILDNTINVDLNNLEDVFSTLGTSYVGIGVISGDINNDGRDEIVVDGDGRIIIYSIDNSLKLTKETQASGSSHSISRRRMALADLDASTTDSLWNPEIIISSTVEYQPDNSPFYNTLELEVFQPIVDPSGDIISIPKRASMRVDSMQGTQNFYWVLAAGDFDGGGIRLGVPKYYRYTDIVQPLVILNAPPTHFDIVNDTPYDVNKSYNNQTTDFHAKYFSESQTEIEVSTELHQDWVIGGSVSGGLTIPVVDIGVKLKIEGKYGRKFSKKTINKQIYKVSQNITASNDDYIYALITNYDVWEYPVFANDTLQGYTLVVTPGLTTRSWFPSKSPQAEEYLPDHEVGNILSYNQISSPTENSSLKTAVKWNTSDEFTLGASSSYNWSLENENSTEETTTNEVEWSIGASLDFNIPFKYIPNFELNGNYTERTVSTSSNKATFRKGLSVNLGSIDLGIGETYYSVIPYSYWAQNGALVLDYAVNPAPSGIGVPQTWWQENYSDKPDAALILPWRLDPEKGFSISEDKRYQTKEIIFNPDEPEAGETINIKARIHNYSLYNTAGPVNASFYLGDPENGGTLIESNDGKTIFSTNDFIAARESKIINFDWTLPENTPYFPRIYVLLDPANEIDEIHENNNKGWKVLNFADGTTGVENENILNSYDLKQNFPNPFNPNTTIEYLIPKASHVSLKIYDILGSEVTTLVNEEMKPGRYSINFNASNFASGVYFYRIQAGNFVQTKKMILMK